MSGRNRKQNVINTIDSVRRNIELIDHISSQNANKLNSRFKKINDELEKLYEHQSKSKKKSLSDPIPDPIPEDNSLSDPIPESPIRRNSSSLEDDLFNRVGKRAKSMRRSRGRPGSHKGGSKKKRSRKK